MMKKGGSSRTQQVCLVLEVSCMAGMAIWTGKKTATLVVG